MAVCKNEKRFCFLQNNLTRAAMRRSVLVLGVATTAAAFSPLPSVSLRYLGLRPTYTFFSAIRQPRAPPFPSSKSQVPFVVLCLPCTCVSLSSLLPRSAKSHLDAKKPTKSEDSISGIRKETPENHSKTL